MPVVETCTGTRRPGSDICAGPPHTFPGGHNTTPSLPVDHIYECQACFATMLQCLRAGCKPAGEPIIGYAERMVRMVGARFTAQLSHDSREEARQAVLVGWFRKLMNTPGWAPEVVAGPKSIHGLANTTVSNLFINWLKKNDLEWPTPDETLTNLIDAGHTGSRRVGKRHLVDPHSRRSNLPADPVGDRITDRMSHIIVSPQGEIMVENALQTIRNILAKRFDHDARLLAAFMHHTAGGQRKPSLRGWWQEYGNGTYISAYRTYKRAIATVQQVVSTDFDPDEDTRDFNLMFLRRLLSFAEPIDESDDR